MSVSFEMYPTIITPFTDDNQIDYASLEKLITLFAHFGADGIFAVCQSSEMFFLSDSEKLELAGFCIESCRRHHIKCVVSGHTQDETEDQIAYLKKLEALGPDAIIMVNNRFARQDESEEVCIRHFNRIVSALKADTRLGVYECPYPYKRLISDELLQAMIQDGRFLFVKDTCCKIESIRHRLEILKGSGIQLYNANAATLYDSISAGAAGYSGVMLNIIPEIFTLLKESFAEQGNLLRAQAVCSAISAASVIEYQNYPANAKYAMMKQGIFKTTLTRNGKPPLTESQMKEMDDFIARLNLTGFHLLPHCEIMKTFRNGVFFPSCHASSILPLDNGRVLITYFAGAHENADDVGIWLSVYDGFVWNTPKCVAKVNDTAHWNPVIYSIPNGLRITFKVGRTIPGWTSWYIDSHDEGNTWSEPVAYGDAVGPVRSKPIRLSNGTLLAPNSVETAESWLPRVDVSYDDGASYTKLADLPVNRESPEEATFISGLGAIQPTLWESAPGKVHALLRTTCGHIFRSDSADYGKTWCTAYNTGLPNNNSGIDVTYANGSLYLVMNPVSGNWSARTPIVIMKSTDNGNTFHNWKVLADTMFDDGDFYENTHKCEFSYPAITEKNGTLYISFTYNRTSIAFAAVSIE